MNDNHSEKKLEKTCEFQPKRFLFIRKGTARSRLITHLFSFFVPLSYANNTVNFSWSHSALLLFAFARSQAARLHSSFSTNIKTACKSQRFIRGFIYGNLVHISTQTRAVNERLKARSHVNEHFSTQLRNSLRISGSPSHFQIHVLTLTACFLLTQWELAAKIPMPNLISLILPRR